MEARVQHRPLQVLEHKHQLEQKHKHRQALLRQQRQQRQAQVRQAQVRELEAQRPLVRVRVQPKQPTLSALIHQFLRSEPAIQAAYSFRMAVELRAS
jgi:hypothetical protein